MQKITKQTKAIADKYLAAKVSGNFDTIDINPSDPTALLNAIKAGKVYKPVLNTIETKFVSVTSMLMASNGTIGYISDAYKKAIYKGFKALLQK